MDQLSKKDDMCLLDALDGTSWVGFLHSHVSKSEIWKSMHTLNTL